MGEDTCDLPRTSKTLLRWTLKMGSSDIVKISSVPETLELIRKIDTDIAIVSIMGPYRSGKSFLLNRITPHFEGVDPFKVGHTVKPETEEVSMAIIPPCATGIAETVLIMDSPGLFAPNRAGIFDSQLLAILNLLSSVVLYNNVNIIDRSAIEKLSYAIDTAFAMSYFEQADSGNSISRPALVWIIQNFHLQHLSEDGKEVRGSEWIGKLLAQMDQSNNGTSTFAKQFTDFFSALDIKTLPFPVRNIDTLRNLSTMPDSEMNPDYVSQVKELWKYVLKTAKPKNVGKLRMSGLSLARIVEKWTENMNVPIGDYRANSAVDLLDHIMSAEVSGVTVKYAALMAQRLDPPMSEGDIREMSRKVIAEIISDKPSPLFKQAVENAIKPLLQGHIEANKKTVEEFVSALIKEYNSTKVMGLFDAASARDRLIAEVLKNDTNPVHIRALKDAVEPLIVAYRKANEEYIKTSLDAISKEVNISLTAALIDLVSAASSSSDDPQWMSVETDHLNSFKSKTESLGIPESDLVKKLDAQFRKTLRSAIADAVGQIFLTKALKLFRECLPLGTEKCRDQAQVFWSEKIVDSLSKAWSDQKEAFVKDIVEETRTKLQLNEFLDIELSKIQTLAALQECYKSSNGPALSDCVEQAQAACKSTSCPEIFGLAYAEICKAQTAEGLHKSSELVSWWMFDRNGGWQERSELIKDFTAAFIGPMGTCTIRNSSEAFELRDQTVQNIEAATQHRANCIAAVTAICFVVSILAGYAIVSSRFCNRGNKDIRNRMQKETSMIASMWCSAGALLVCIVIAFISPGYTARLDGADFSSGQISSEHGVLTLLLIAEVYFSFHELKGIRFRANQTKYEPVDTER